MMGRTVDDGRSSGCWEEQWMTVMFRLIFYDKRGMPHIQKGMKVLLLKGLYIPYDKNHIPFLRFTRFCILCKSYSLWANILK